MESCVLVHDPDDLCLSIQRCLWSVSIVTAIAKSISLSIFASQRSYDHRQSAESSTIASKSPDLLRLLKTQFPSFSLHLPRGVSHRQKWQRSPLNLCLFFSECAESLIGLLAHLDVSQCSHVLSRASGGCSFELAYRRSLES